MLSIKNFRYRIIAKTSFIFILLWSISIYTISYKTIAEFENEQKSEGYFNKNNVTNKITEIQENYRKKLLKLSKLSLKNKYYKNEEEKKQIIKGLWADDIVENQSYNIGYYNKNYEFSDLSNNQNFFYSTEGLSKEVIEQHTYSHANSFFYCNILCELYILNPVSSVNSSQGILQVSIPIDNIMDEAIKTMSHMDLIILRKTNNPNESEFSIKKSNYKLEVSSSIFFLDDFKKTLTDPITQEFSFIEKEDSHYAILVINNFKDNDIILLLTKNLSSERKKLNTTLWQTIQLSSIVLVFVLLLLNYLINQSMLRLKILSSILKIIGNGQFNKAKEILDKTGRKQVYDELDLIYNSTNKLTSQLENMHVSLQKSNQSLTNSLQEVRFLADHDTLTSLFNRRRFNKELIYICESKQPFYLVSTDLNHFKLINDSLGHAKGDELLIEVSRIIIDIIGKKGFTARMGGDEFSIAILSDSDAVVNDLLSRISDKVKNLTLDENAIFRAGISLGVAKYPSDSLVLSELAAFADAAMYENKRYKKNIFNFYTGEETIIKEEKKSQYWGRVINESLSSKFIVLMFQPIVDNKNQQIFAYEVLTRLKFDEKVHMPNDFISYAEKNNSIIQLDRLIFESALRKAIIIKERPILSINLSYTTMSSIGIIDYIINCIKTYEYPAENIILEITEGVEIANIEDVKSFIITLKKHGIRFALDDFGAGYSSFLYLTELNIDIIKIDKSLIAGLLYNKTDHYVIESIVLLAQKMRIEIVAEGIENYETATIMNNYNINYLQGYYFSRPQDHFSSLESNPPRVLKQIPSPLTH